VPLIVPEISVPDSLIAPDVAISEVIPAPPSETRPARLMAAAVRLTAFAVTLPAPDTVNKPASVMVVLGPPETVASTVSEIPSFIVKPIAENGPRLATWFVVGVVPSRLAAVAALPLRVPETSVPVSVIAPELARRCVVPAPPSETRPAIPMLVAAKLTA
jgi:hypothetical protein